MAQESLADLVKEIKTASETIAAADEATKRRMEGLEASINELYKKVQRPGPAEFTANDNNADLIRKDAIGLCHIRRALQVPKNDGMTTYEPSPAEIDDAQNYRRSLLGLWRHGDPNRLEQNIRKS